MMVSTKGRYALRVMIDLAQHDSEAPVPLKAISERQHISQKYLEAIVAMLNRIPAGAAGGRDHGGGSDADDRRQHGAGGLPGRFGRSHVRARRRVPHTADVGRAGSADRPLPAQHLDCRPDRAPRADAAFRRKIKFF